MARIRAIKHDFYLDERLAELPLVARLAFPALWTLADREGRLRDSPRRLRAEIFPYEPKTDMETILAELARGGFIIRYRVHGDAFIQIRTWKKHQRPNLREPPSEIPPPAESDPEAAVPDAEQDTCAHVQERACTSMSDCSAAREWDLGMGSGNGNGDPDCSELAEPASEPPPKAPEAPPVLVFPVVGSSKQPTWALTREKLAAYQEAFPGMPVEAECRKARLWVENNPRKRKSASGMPRFLQNWLEHAANRGGVRGSPTAVASVRPAEPLHYCEFHRRFENQGRTAPARDRECAECKHLGALRHPRAPADPEPVGRLL